MIRCKFSLEMFKYYYDFQKGDTSIIFVKFIRNFEETKVIVNLKLPEEN